MAQTTVHFFHEWGWWAVPFSLILSLVLHLIGFVPSVFVTTTNVLFFGPVFGGFLSWVGETLGSGIALYRYGFGKMKHPRYRYWAWIQTLNHLNPKRQWLMLVAARVAPLLPSGAINVIGALTTIRLSLFLSATGVGKIPSIALEALVSHDLLHFGDHNARLALVLISLGLLGMFWEIGKQKPSSERTGPDNQIHS